jgi:hypothetical protein
MSTKRFREAGCRWPLKEVNRFGEQLAARDYATAS